MPDGGFGMSVAAGWYADPWRLASLRWWDGMQWTGHVAGPSAESASDADPSAATTSDERGLTRLVGNCKRIAVVDVETTGLYNSDRIVEIAIVTVDPTGKVTDEFETLTQPLRDVGATWLHGIDAGMLRDAPTFADIAQHVAARVDGAVVTAHNLPFDSRMVGNELRAAGIDIDWGTGLDTLRATGCRLAQACAEHNVPLVGAHRAIADARATAHLLFAVGGAFNRACVPATARPLCVTPMRVCRRDGRARATPPASYLAALAQGVHTSSDVAPYAELLGVALADLRLTDGERRELRSLAADVGLDDPAVARAHREFLNGLIDAAVEDGVVTDSEIQQLCRAAALLDIDVEHVAQRTDAFRAVTEMLPLERGMSVCFTGLGCVDNGEVLDRSTQSQLAKNHGLVVLDSVTKTGPDLLVAGEVDSRSAKARKARRLGIPICAFNDFMVALDGDRAVRAARMASTGVALVCVECGASWMAPRQASRPLCTQCSRFAELGVKEPSTLRRPRAAVSGATGGDLETLICFDCGRRWQRPRSRGRRPGRCPDCSAKEAAPSGARDADLETLICFDCGRSWQRPRSRGGRNARCPACTTRLKPVLTGCLRRPSSSATTPPPTWVVVCWPALRAGSEPWG